MTKCYIVVVNEPGFAPRNLCAFESEGEAEQSAERHRIGEVKAWVEEVNYYGRDS